MNKQLILTTLMVAAIAFGAHAAAISDMQNAAAQLIGGQAAEYTFFNYNGPLGYRTDLSYATLNDAADSSQTTSWPIGTEIVQSLSGLVPSTVYEVYVCAFGHMSAATNADWGIRAGFSSGYYSLASADIAGDYTIAAYNLGLYHNGINNPFRGSLETSNWAVFLGNIKTDASGFGTVYVNGVRNVEVNGITGDRTFYDGVLAVINENPIPFILEHPQDIHIREDQTAQFSTVFYSVTTPSVTWQASDAGVIGTVTCATSPVVCGDYTLHMNYDAVTDAYTSILSISNLNADDQGGYLCVLNNATAVSVVSHMAFLVIRLLSEPQLLARYEFEGNGDDSLGINNGNIQGNPSYVIGFDSSMTMEGGSNLRRAVDLDGSSYYVLPATAYPQARTGGGLEAGTLTAWVKTNTHGHILGVANSNASDSIYMSTNGGQLQDSHGSVLGGGTLVTGANDNQWHFIAMSYSTVANPKALACYVDGMNYITQMPISTAQFTFSGWEHRIHVGSKNNRGIAEPFTGRIDEVRIYNYALSQAEIVNLYHDVTGQNACFLEYASEADFNHDCRIDIQDYTYYVSQWLSCSLYPECI